MRRFSFARAPRVAWLVPGAWILGLLVAASPAGATIYAVNVASDLPDNDPGDDLCDTNPHFGSQCSLRAAVMEANAHAGADAISLPIGTFVLTRAGAGEDAASTGDLDVTGALVIEGAGPEQTIIDANGLDRAFHVLASLDLEQVTVRGGRAEDGGALLYAAGDSILADVVVHGNRATQDGGALRVLADLLVVRAAVVGNIAGGDGGGLALSAGTLEIFDSRFSDNTAADSGGALAFTGGTAEITRSTLSRNDGNAALDVAGGAVALSNSTVSANTSTGALAALAVATTGFLDLESVTVASNRSLGGPSGGLSRSGGDLTLLDTLVADNTGTGGAGDCTGILRSAGFNLIETVLAGCTLSDILTGNLLGVDPALHPLANYRGQTATHAIDDGSAAAGAGDGGACPVNDQRLALRSDCDIGAYEASPSGVPVALAVDPEGNGVLEPEEAATVAPTWSDLNDQSSLQSSTAFFTGPAAAGTVSYLLTDASADYGDPGAAGTSCLDQADCFTVQVDASVDGTRPLRHWDAALTEIDGSPAAVFWRLHLGASFADVPVEAQPVSVYRAAEALLHHRVTAGCDATDFCPDGPVSRQQLAMLLERSRHSGLYLPPACVDGAGTFLDVDPQDPFCPFIEQLEREELTAGCGGGNFCPDGVVTRKQLALLAVRARHGAEFVPPACSGQFDDVAADAFCPWIEQLAVDAPSAACAPPRFCPEAALDRAQLARVLAESFALDVWSLGL